ncbi:hypothetical protein AT251_12320 [Enterovibrio nigricans]|nr:hypothetical protein [Enterovibrio nigricans]PKF50316.1 hypothetical protein AT251_12320 [Enterovibrio nigricans]
MVRNDVITEDIIEQRFVGDSSSLLGVSIGDSFEEKEDGKPVAARPEQLTHRGWITEAVKGLTGHGGAYYSLEVQNGDESANADHQKFAFSIERIENPDGETGKVVTYSTHDALEVVNKDGETVLLPNASPSRIPDFTDNADVLLFRGLSDERGRTQVKVTDYGKGGDVTSKQEFLDIDENLQVTSATLSTSNNENGNAEGKLQYATYRNTTSDYIDGVDDPIYGYDSRGKRMKVVSADAADLEKKHGFSTIRPISDTPDELPQHYSAFGAETIERKVQITFGFVNEEENSGSTELFVTKRFKEGVKETTYVTEFLVLDEGASSKERRHLQQERSQTKSEIKTESINAFGQKAILEDMSVTSPVIVIETQYEDGQIVEQKNRVAKNVKEALEGGQLGNFAVIQSQVKSALDNHKDNETLENLYAVVTELASFDGDTNISMSGFDSHLYQPQESDLFMQVLDHVEENPKVREKFGLELIYPLDNSLAQKRISRDEEASLLDEFTDVSGTNVSSGVIGDVFDLKNKADDLLSDAYGIDKLIEGTESFTDGVKSALQDPTNRDALIALLSDDEDVALSLKGQSDSYITAQLERSLARIGHDILAAGFESGDPALIDKKELTISRLILENEIAGQNIDVPKDKHFNASSWISLARAWLPSATLAGGLVYSVSNLLNQRVENGNSIGQGGVSIHDTNHGIRQLEKYKSFINDVFSDVTNKRAASKANTFFYDAVRKSDATSANQLVKATALNLAIKEVVDSAPYKLATLKLTDVLMQYLHQNHLKKVGYYANWYRYTDT